MITRAVIVNADDFGQSAGINRGIIEAHERGIVTSASLMVRCDAAAEAATYAREHPRFSVGLHVDLCEWWCREGEWLCLYERVDGSDAVAVENEIRGQLEAFRDLLGRDPTHLDSHQHVHHTDPARSILIRIAAATDVPLRNYSPLVRYAGEFYGQSPTGRSHPEAISASRLRALLQSLPTGITELGCHPGYAEDVPTMYRAERALEVEALCSPEARQVFEQGRVRLMSFLELAEIGPARS